MLETVRCRRLLHFANLHTHRIIEHGRKNCLLSLDFDEISEVFVEEGTIESFVQDATTKVSFL